VQESIEAIITFMTASAGGRKSPVHSGYRPQFWYMGLEWDAEHFYPDKEVVKPGDTVKAKLRFFRPHTVHVGMPFQVREGRQIVAEGVVTKV
jgi:elongation factor Tu